MGDSKIHHMTPVPPDALEVIVFYKCPFCSRHIGLPAPTEPRMVSCDACRRNFPIIPVDEFGLHYLRIMTAGGKAAADADFL